jgi:hypothetical protein
MDPATPTAMVIQMSRSYTTYKNNMMVNAGGKGIGKISISIAPKKTSTYCHHIEKNVKI